MTPELWNAKKIVDSTLHPGMSKSKQIGKPRTQLTQNV